MSNIDQFTFGFYPSSTKPRSNFIKYHEPTKLYPSNSGKININLNSYRHNTNILQNKHNHIHKRKDHNNNFNVNHKTKVNNINNINNIMNSHSKIEKNNLEQMLSNLKQEITEITNNIKETDNKVNYYMNKDKNINDTKKIRHNSVSPTNPKNIFFLPKKKSPFSTRGGGISLNLINSNYSKSTNYIRNPSQKRRTVTEYISNINTNTNNNYNNKNKINDNININKLTIQTSNNYNYPLHRVNCLSSYYDRKKLCNNYLYDIRPKYHTCENFYHREKNKKPLTYVYKSSKINYTINTINDIDNSNNITEKSLKYLNQDFINDSIKKILKSSSHKNNLINNNISLNMNKYLLKNEIKKKVRNNFRKGACEPNDKFSKYHKYNITSPNTIINNISEDTKCNQYKYK